MAIAVPATIEQTELSYEIFDGPNAMAIRVDFYNEGSIEPNGRMVKFITVNELGEQVGSGWAWTASLDGSSKFLADDGMAMYVDSGGDSDGGSVSLTVDDGGPVTWSIFDTSFTQAVVDASVLNELALNVYVPRLFLQDDTINNDQVGWAWFDSRFNINEDRVGIEFDLFIGRSTSETPADGVSVIFQFDNDLTATGDAGGGLEVCNFRQQKAPYISVGFDIWDNGAATND